MDDVFPGPVTYDDIVSRIESHPLGDDVTTQRRRFARLVLGDRVEQPERGGVTFAGEGGTIVYFHGGGYAFGSPRTHERIGRGLAERTGLNVLLPAYPLAPESPWPAQLDSAMATLRTTTGPIVLAGDSAGGHLALVTALALGRAGTTAAGLVLFSPNTDRSGLSETRSINDPFDPMVDDVGDRELAQQCFGDRSVDDPQVSPVLDDLTLLPPVHIEVGSGEVLLGDSLVLADRARTAGRSVSVHVDPVGLHMGQLWAPWWPSASASLDRAATFIRSVVGSQG